ncbi:hypothetical protein GY45DRAFT_1299387 [Cubamyces sp. BRFM 1775]|nr:hypothetical protein GY45DRAFT_1299387 [Cubamyces sp. BRFM 1775]
MPLPANVPLTLHGQSRPEDPLHTKPKRAMIFRMSAETFEQLEDLQNPPKLQFEFGKTPGLYINDTFFPVTATQDKVTRDKGSHELYLRMASAQKPMAPLKLYANVVGKFVVERQLGEKIEGTIRDRTIEAEKQRTERKAIYLDTPPDTGYTGPKGKTKKDASAPRRTAVASSSHTASARASRVASPLPGSSSHANGSTHDPARARLIHCLALKERKTEHVITMCGGKDCSPQTKSQLLSILRDVAELKPVAKNSEPGPQFWKLKLQSWLEVRPYEWPLSSEERLSLSRQARQAYKELKIPEADPIWEHVRYREDPGLGASARSVAGPSATTAPKKGVLSKGTVKKKAEGTRKKLPDIIIAKDESVRPVKDASSAKGKARERDVDEGSAAGTPTSATRPPIRRLPGSGYKVKASATPPAPEERANSPLPPPPPKRTGPVDARESRRELPAPSGSAKPLPPIAPPSVPQEHKAASSTPQFRKKTKDAAERPLEERREERQRERERQAVAEERQRAKGQASPLPAASAALKRKKLPQDGNDSEPSERDVPLSAGSPKKRRLEEQSATSDKARVRDLSLPKKPVTHEPSPLSGSRPKVKKEPSPLSIAFSPPPSAASRSSLPPRPSLPEKPQPPSSSSSSTKDDPPHRASSTSKRRRSPVYTSSEDESDSHRSSRARVSGRAAAEEPAAKKAKTKHATRFRPREEMPTDRAKLRRYYKSTWYVYFDLFREQAHRRDRIEHMLRQNEGEDGAEAPQDEGDVEELDPDALMAFMEEYKAVTEELNRIEEQWKRLGGNVAELKDESKSP